MPKPNALMATPGARIRLKSEDVDEKIITPSIKFSEQGGRPVMIITIGIGKPAAQEDPKNKNYTHHVPDTNKAKASEKEKFRDANYGNEFFLKGPFAVSFTPTGVSSTVMNISATLPTKVPGTGGLTPMKKSKRALPKKKR